LDGSGYQKRVTSKIPPTGGELNEKDGDVLEHHLRPWKNNSLHSHNKNSGFISVNGASAGPCGNVPIVAPTLAHAQVGHIPPALLVWIN
jgi:hypothetical protein